MNHITASSLHYHLTKNGQKGRKERYESQVEILNNEEDSTKKEGPLFFFFFFFLDRFREKFIQRPPS